MKRALFLLPYILFLSMTASFADESAPEMGSISGDIFEKRSKWYHPYLSLYEAYDDNIFNTEKERVSDFITIVSPGIQLTVPGTEQRAEDIVTDPTTPGGLVFGRFTKTSFRRFRAYAGYAPWLQFYADNEDENVVNHYAQAGLQINFRGGLSLDAANRFDKNYDRRRANTSPRTDSYGSNLFTLTSGYLLSEKLKIQAEYSNFQVQYSDDAKNGFRDRTDNSGIGYAFFKVRPKTAIYLKYRYTDITYRNDLDRNGDEQDLSAGFRWDFTAKTNLNLQAGYGMKNFENSAYDAGDSFICQANVNYQLSSKTRLGLNGYHRNEESPDQAYDYTVTTVASFKYFQALNYKIDFELDASYRHDDYRSGDAGVTETESRIDDHFVITPSFSYAFKRWLSVSLAYSFRRRDSDIDRDSYAGNVVMLKITGSL